MRHLWMTCFAVVLLASARPAGAGGRTWLTSLRPALEEAEAENRLILVDLYADWCGWCKRLEAEVFDSAPFQEYAGKFVLLRVDTEDGGEGTRIQERFQVDGLPTTLVLDHREVKVAEIPGFAPARQYISRIEQGIASFLTLESAYERFRQSTDLNALDVLAEEFYQRGDGERAAVLYQKMLSVGELGEPDSVETRYRLADALRLAGRYDNAQEELRAVRLEAERLDSQSLIEHLDLLAARIALDRGDCQTARSGFKRFLDQHPSSRLQSYARRTLAALAAEEFRCS